MHLVTRGHFRSCDKDGGHTIRSAIGENPMLYTHFMAVCFLEPKLLPMEVLHCGNRDFGPLLLLRHWPDDHHMNLTRIIWRYTGCATVNFLRLVF